MGSVYPTAQHEFAAEAISRFFSKIPIVDAVILSGSCARGDAVPDSCLDVIILVSEGVLSKEYADMDRLWREFYDSGGVFKALLQVGRYSHVDLEFINGCFAPKPRDWTSGPDDFELEIGNTLVYSVPLWERGDRLKLLREMWLPYYGDELRRERLASVRMYCLNNLDHVPLYVDRGLHFQAFKRLYDAFREFLQGLFISRRTYPIAYDKWVRKQVEGILGMPELYGRLVRLLEIDGFESSEIADKAQELRILFGDYIEE